ncbi:LOW QUALITY PROTEIN: hypothetical protein NC652_027275 [Populus alba x Populus x berolinensis]|nr:LOW QUALITY PROTEIN: hypothetical protein NC652_027275 [Populus alba x Populus x berolinensis]
MVFFGYGAKGMEAVLALYMRILLFILLQTLFWIPFTLLLWVAFVLLPSLPLARFLHGAMAVSVHWGMYHRELFPRLVEGSWDGKTRHISTTGIHSSAITASEKMHEEIKELLPIRKGLLNQTSSYLAMYRLPRTLVHILSFACCHSSGSYYGNRGSLYLGLRRRRWQIRPWPWSGMVLAEEGQVWNWGGEDDEGQVLSWGFDGHCQLGHSSIQCQKIPAVIDALADQHAIHVTCGGSSLAAITASKQRTGGSGMDTRSKARTLSGPVSDPSKLPKWNHDGSQFYCSAGTNASYSCYHQLAEIHHENDPHKYASPVESLKQKLFLSCCPFLIQLVDHQKTYFLQRLFCTRFLELFAYTFSVHQFSFEGDALPIRTMRTEYSKSEKKS